MKHRYKYKICVSGAAAGECLDLEVKKKAEAVGREIAKSGAALTTGATIGLPYFASRGAKNSHGLVFGFSPASTKGEHVRKYRLPIDYVDVIVYTGAGYAGRNLILTRSSDAVVVVCGRIGTLNEFTVAFEDKKVIGVLEDSGGITGELHDILDVAKRGCSHIIFDKDPKKLIKRVLKEIRIVDRSRNSVGRDMA